MNQTDSYLQIPTRIEETAVRNVPLERGPRLIVVIPDVQNEALLANRIASLAQPSGWPVLLVGIAANADGEASLRRRLITVAAFLRDQGLPKASSVMGRTPASGVEIRLEHGRDWIGKIKALMLPDDLLACSEDESVGFPARPLNDLLCSSLNATVYTFSTLSRVTNDRPRFHKQVLPWLGSLASIGGFIALQARIVVATQGLAQTVLLLVSLLGEVGLIWLLNSWFGQA